MDELEVLARSFAATLTPQQRSALALVGAAESLADVGLEAQQVATLNALAASDMDLVRCAALQCLAPDHPSLTLCRMYLLTPLGERVMQILAELEPASS